MHKIESKDIVFLETLTNKIKSAVVFRVTFDEISQITNYIDKYIIDLIYADPLINLTVAKARMKRFIHDKSANDKHGIVAEMISHIVIREELGMQQLSLLVNLEGNDLKKGFDGVYQTNNDVWFGESKSSYTNGTLHKDNLNEALNCFKDKIDGSNSNNPWNNAINHFARLNNGVVIEESLRKRIGELNSNFELGTYSRTEQYNVIPISTLFVDDEQSFDDVVEDTKRILSRVAYNKMIFLCIDNSFYDSIISYLDG